MLEAESRKEYIEQVHLELSLKQRHVSTRLHTAG